tara:strand:- start:165 stop:467 length:303 start_codon:yes stop_codon:yes gene_type:complete
LLLVLSSKGSLLAQVCDRLVQQHKHSKTSLVLDKRLLVRLVSSKWLDWAREWVRLDRPRWRHNNNLVLGYKGLGLGRRDKLEFVRLRRRHWDSRRNGLVR